MSFEVTNFAPAFISGTKTIRLFVYANDKDPLSEIMEPGYFNSQRILLHKNSMIDVVASDHVARIVVGEQDGLNVVIRDEVFLGADPYVDLKKRVTTRRKTVQKKKAEEKLAKTG